MSHTMTEISKLIKRQECESIKQIVILSENDLNAESSDSALTTNENSVEKLPVSF